MAEWQSSAEPAKSEDDPVTSRRNTRIGLVLFAFYSLPYIAFILINAFWPDVMDWTPLAGLNLAILFGFGLILGAFVLSVVYGWLCREPAHPSLPPEDRP